LIIRKKDGVRIEALVSDPLGRKIKASFGLIDNGKTAVIEMANASGIRLLKADELNPLKATTYGTGEQLKLALDNDATQIIIGMGGSATVDGAVGILSALGIRFLDADGVDLTGLPGSLIHLSRIDVSGLDKRVLDCEVIVLCDVNNFLLGTEGAAAVFGPQKGASPDDVESLDAALAKFADIASVTIGKDITSIKHGGTAGGAAAGLYAFLNAKLVNGIDYFLQLTEFDKALEQADIVITGEGSIDDQTLQGKGPFGVAAAAKLREVPVICLAGRVPLETSPQLHEYFDVLMAIGNEPVDMPTALQNAGVNLSRAAAEMGNTLALKLK
jgi:glycerate kinase